MRNTIFISKITKGYVNQNPKHPNESKSKIIGSWQPLWVEPGGWEGRIAFRQFSWAARRRRLCWVIQIKIYRAARRRRLYRGIYTYLGSLYTEMDIHNLVQIFITCILYMWKPLTRSGRRKWVLTWFCLHLHTVDIFSLQLFKIGWYLIFPIIYIRLTFFLSDYL